MCKCAHVQGTFIQVHSRFLINTLHLSVLHQHLDISPILPIQEMYQLYIRSVTTLLSLYRYHCKTLGILLYNCAICTVAGSTLKVANHSSHHSLHTAPPPLHLVVYKHHYTYIYIQGVSSLRSLTPCMCVNVSQLVPPTCTYSYTVN